MNQLLNQARTSSLHGLRESPLFAVRRVEMEVREQPVIFLPQICVIQCSSLLVPFSVSSNKKSDSRLEVQPIEIGWSRWRIGHACVGNFVAPSFRLGRHPYSWHYLGRVS